MQLRMLRARLASVVLKTVDTVRELVARPTLCRAVQRVGVAAAVATSATQAIVTMRVAGMARAEPNTSTVVAAAGAPVPSLNEAAVADAASTEAEVETVTETETVTAATLGT